MAVGGDHRYHHDARTFVSHDVPLMVAAGGPLVEYVGSTMHPRHADLARGVISGCAPFNTLRLRKRLVWMVKVKNPGRVSRCATGPSQHDQRGTASHSPVSLPWPPS